MLLWAILAILFTAGASKPEVCNKPPKWTINGQPIMETTKGNVTLVALLTASVPFCQQQAENLEALLQEFYLENITNLSFFIINLKLPSEELMINDLKEKVTFPVYQDNDYDNVWQKLQGGSNDIYIYDKCGRLTYYIPFPFSLIHSSQPIVSAALHSTYFDELCGKLCNINMQTDAIFSDYNKSIDHNYMKINGSTNNTEILNVKDYKSVLNDLNKSPKIMVEDVSEEFVKILNKTDLSSDFNITELFNITTEKENITKYYPFYPNELQLNISNETMMHEENKTSVISSAEININASSTHCEKEYKEICSLWSKNKLKHANKCCRFKEKTYLSTNNSEISDCRHFGRKKCKKMLPILKCCLGTITFITKPTTVNSTLIVKNETTKYLENTTVTHSVLATLAPKKNFLQRISK